MKGRAEPAPTAAARRYGLVWRAGALAVGALTLGGCATAVLGVHETFQIVSSPAGAHVSLSTGETCVTPCSLELPRTVAFQARVSLPGYATQVIPVASRLSAGGAVGFLGNSMIGGVIGASADLESGAMRSLFPNPLRVRLSPLPPESSAQNH
ncbi:MAG TPA: translation initiation factor 2 [Caulobacteraceae bacterium]